MNAFMLIIVTPIIAFYLLIDWPRMTRTLEENFVVTIEPGLYFIPMLLAQLKAGPHAAHVNWSKIDHLTKFGGIRIEDEVRATTGAPENLTRDAFAVA